MIYGVHKVAPSPIVLDAHTDGRHYWFPTIHGAMLEKGQTKVKAKAIGLVHNFIIPTS